MSFKVIRKENIADGYFFYKFTFRQNHWNYFEESIQGEENWNFHPEKHVELTVIPW